MKKICASSLFLLLFVCVTAQVPLATQHYWIFFKDKDLALDPRADFSAQALMRRAKQGIAFPMIEDYPVNAVYVQSVTALVTETRHALRWFNAVSVAATPQQVAQVRQLPFVAEVAPFMPLETALAEHDEALAAADSAMLHQLFDNQRDLVHLQALENAGLTGKGLRIAVFDAGFSGADTHIAFALLRANNQIKLVKDFVSGGEKVYGHSKHGTAVLSCIAGMYEGHRLGAAVDAEFLLARTERNLSEPKSEEDNWMAAMEWADQNGADIISSSLGYSKPRYDYADMTGSKTLVSQAAAMAVRKGILVVNSAGNEGSGKFRYIAAPSDADSVLTVGGAYPMLAVRMPFSSLGPNANGVLKPEICGPGFMLAAHKDGGYSTFAGTSFACPMVAGMAACIMQNWPDESNMQIKQRIIAAGNTYPYFDYGLGYGVLDAQKVLQAGPTDVPPTFAVEVVRDTFWITVDRVAMVRDSAKYKSGKPFSYHVVKPNGKLSSYKTILLNQKQLRFGIPPASAEQGKTEMWFQGYCWREQDLQD